VHTTMEKYLRENFHVEPKRPSEDAQRRWRSAVSIVKNPRRRFRWVANLAQRADAEQKRKKLQVSFLLPLFIIVLFIVDQASFFDRIYYMFHTSNLFLFEIKIWIVLIHFRVQFFHSIVVLNCCDKCGRISSRNWYRYEGVRGNEIYF